MERSYTGNYWFQLTPWRRREATAIHPLTGAAIKLVLAGTVAIGVVGTSHAKPGGAAPSAVAEESPAATGASEGVLHDTNSGAVFVAPSALTSPQGTWTVQDTELFFIGASYALTDTFSLSAHTLVPIDPGEFQPYLLSGKVALINHGRLRLAAQAVLAGALIDTSDDNDTFSSLVAGGAATYCLDSECHSYLNGYVGGGFLLDLSESQNSVPLILSAGLVQKLSRHVKLAVEIDSGAVAGEYDAVADGILAFYGVRFTSTTIGVNAGLVRPFGKDVDLDVFPLGFPWVSFTYRALPGG